MSSFLVKLHEPAPVVPYAHARALGGGAVGGVVGGGAAVGLFETTDQVKNYAARVNTQIQSIDSDILNDAVKKYGPDGFAATVSADQLSAFQADKAFYKAWSAFQANWNTFYASILNAIIDIRSADTYRQVGVYDEDSLAWRQRAEDRGITLNAPPLTQQSALPGILPNSNPSLSSFSWTKLALIAGAVGVGYWVLFRRRTATGLTPAQRVASMAGKIAGAPKPTEAERYAREVNQDVDVMEMRGILQRHGFDPDTAGPMVSRGIRPSDLRMHLVADRTTAVRRYDLHPTRTLEYRS